MDQTIRQAAFLLDRLDARKSVATIFIGGGTPSVLPPPLLGKLLEAFSDITTEEWTVEANPETVNEGFLESCGSRGSPGSASGCRVSVMNGFG